MFVIKVRSGGYVAGADHPRLYTSDVANAARYITIEQAEAARRPSADERVVPLHSVLGERSFEEAEQQLAMKLSPEADGLVGQKARIYDWLKTGAELDRITALIELGVFEAPARICELRELGHDITTRMETVTNRYGEKTRIAKWRLNR